MERIRRVATVVLGVTLLVQTVPAYAAWLPLGGLASIKRFAPVSVEPETSDDGTPGLNLSYVPVLLDLARVVGRYGHHQGYFLLKEPLSNQPGVDLKSLLIQTGPLHLKDGLTGPVPNGPVQPDTQKDMLAVPAMRSQMHAPPPGSSADVPLLAVHPVTTNNTPVQMKQPVTEVARPESINLEVEDSSDHSQLISMDFTGVAAALTGMSESGQPQKRFVESPQLQSTFAIQPDMSRALSAAFMLWTISSGTTSGANEVHQFPLVPMDGQKTFAGTFVACTQGTKFTGMRNRLLVMQKGRILAAVRGLPLSIETATAIIHMDPNTSALIDAQDNSLKIVALESDDPKAKIEISVAGKSDRQRLSAGQQIQFGPDAAAGKTPVEISTILEKEPLLNASAGQLSDSQRAVLEQLRQRLVDSRTVSK